MCWSYWDNRVLYLKNEDVFFSSKHGDGKFVTEETHYTRETQLRQGDEVQILWNADVLCRWGHFCPISCFSIRQHLCSSISPFLQANRETTNVEFISACDKQRCLLDLMLVLDRQKTERNQLEISHVNHQTMNL